MKKNQKLKDLFKKEGMIRLVGAHNGLTAKLVERNGFEGVWASGLEISTSHAVPDANILSMSDVLAATVDVNDATSIPVVADCDTGFGNSNNVIQMVKKFESAGIDAVCIEDKLFPKVNSYIPGRQELAPIAEFVGKIMAGKNAQRTNDFMIFARIEALIAGWGQEEALKRAKAYADAGADAILIHSKQKTPDEIIKFVKAWNNYKPLIIVPTTYPSLTEEQIKKLGIKMVIYANQGLRASIKGINKILARINQYGISDIDDKIASMSEVFEIQGMGKMKNDEKKYLKAERGNIKAIIPAAGESNEESLKDLLRDIPITVLDINGKTILQRAVENLNNVGIQDIAVTIGYQGDKISDEGVIKIKNPEYQNTGVVHSIMKADEWLKESERILMIYSDTLFERDILEKLIKSDEDIVLVIDKSYRSTKFPDRMLDLVVAKYVPINEDRVMNIRKSNPILRIGNKVSREEANYEFIGMAMFSKKGFEILKSEYQELKEKFNRDRTKYSNFPNIDFTDLLQKIIEKGQKVETVEVNGGWMEIRDFDGYKRACRLLTE